MIRLYVFWFQRFFTSVLVVVFRAVAITLFSGPVSRPLVLLLICRADIVVDDLENCINCFLIKIWNAFYDFLQIIDHCFSGILSFCISSHGDFSFRSGRCCLLVT